MVLLRRNLKSNVGEIEISTPRDADFDPIIVNLSVWKLLSAIY